MSRGLGANLIMNSGGPQVQPGAAADLSSTVANSLINLFSPGGQNMGPTKRYDNPLEGKLVPRFEMPSTMSTVNIGEVVVFSMMSNGETFYTDTICPIVPWGWAIKKITYGTWVFPQYPVAPTPETAPPRYPESYTLSDTTTLSRYAIGDHKSVEYMNTERGRLNQTYTLKQIALSVQETLNLNVIIALMNSQHKVAERRERNQGGGSYSYSDLMQAYDKQIRRFASVQKDRFGFQKVVEEIQTEAEEIQGNFTAVIMTKKVNSLVITRPELTRYDEAGPAGPARVADPERTMLPAGIGLTTYYSNTYKNKVNAKLGPWEKLLQIGEFYTSEEVARNNTSEYLRKWSSKLLSAWIFNAYTNKFEEITFLSMLSNCMVWNPSNGELLDPKSDKGTPLSEKEPGDFLMMKSSDIINGTWENEDPFQGRLDFSKQGMGATSGRFDARNALDGVGSKRGKSNGFNEAHWKSIQLLGHVAEEHFGKDNFLESGEMILHRISERSHMNYQDMMLGIQNGLRLFKTLSEQPVDLEFVDFVVSDATLTMYMAENPNVDTYTSVYSNNSPTAQENKMFNDTYVDPSSVNTRELWPKVAKSMLVQRQDTEEGTNVAKKFLKNVESGEMCLPLPVSEKYSSPNYSKHWPNLTGYASYPGLVAMAQAYSSVISAPSSVTSRYNTVHLKEAFDFVNIMRHFVATINEIIPNCSLFGPNSNDLIKAKVIAEKLFNMVGLPIWVDLRKTSTFLIDTSTADIRNSNGSYLANKGSFDDFLTSQSGIDWYAKLMWNSFSRGITEVNPSDIVSTIKDFLTKSTASPSKSSSKSRPTASGNLEKFRTSGKVWANGPTTVDDYVSLLATWTKSQSINIQSGIANTVAAARAKTLKTQALEWNTKIGSLVSGTGYSLMLSGPFRIAAYKMVWLILRAGISYFGANVGSFLNLIEDLASLMLVTDDEKVNYKYSGKSLGETRGDLSAKYLSSTKSKSSFTPLEIKGILLGIWEGYFSEHSNYEDQKARLGETLQSALEDNDEYVKSLDPSSGVASIKIYTLVGLDDSSVIDAKGNVSLGSSPITFSGFLENISNSNLDVKLGVSGKVPGYTGDAYDAVFIGGGQKKRVSPSGWEKSLDASANVGDFIPELDAMISTSLVLSAEQIRYLYRQGTYGKANGSIFDIRVTNPFNMRTYVPRDKLGILVKEIETQASKSSGSGDLIHWRQVPLMTAENKLKTTAFSGTSHRPYGVPITFLNKSFKKTCQEIDKSSSTYNANKAATLLYMLAPCNLPTLKALVKGNVRTIFRFYMFRNINLITEACAFVNPGISNLGFTALAGKDYITGQTVLTKEWNSHLSFWSGVIILRPENCYILENMMINGVREGFGTVFHTDPKKFNPGRPIASGEFLEDAPSLFAIAIPYNEAPPQKNFIATPGKIPQLGTSTRSNAMKVSRAMENAEQYSTCRRYDGIWGFGKTKDSNITGFLKYLGPGGNLAIYNTVCFQGTTKYWNPKKQAPKYVRLGRGHLGKNVGDGFADVLKGNVITFTDYHYDTDTGYDVV